MVTASEVQRSGLFTRICISNTIYTLLMTITQAKFSDKRTMKKPLMLSGGYLNVDNEKSRELCLGVDVWKLNVLGDMINLPWTDKQVNAKRSVRTLVWS